MVQKLELGGTNWNARRREVVKKVQRKTKEVP